MLKWMVSATLLVLGGCRNDRPHTPAIPLGEARLAVPGGRIWYRVSGTGTGLPLVLIHGGPGFSSFYLKPFEDLGDDRIVVRYDQLGGGKSDTTSDTTLFTIGHFVAELDSLRSALGIERWHLLGHSWGTILAVEYYRSHADRVASLTFGSPVFDADAYERHAAELLTTLSDSAQRAIHRAEATKVYDSPAYQHATEEFDGKYLFHSPVPADLDSSMATFNQGIYMYLQGPSEVTIVGTLKHYRATDLLPQIRVPTLLTVGGQDEVGPDLVRSHAALIPGSRFELFPGAAHMTPWDARDANVGVVRAFLRSADSTRTTGR